MTIGIAIGVIGLLLTGVVLVELLTGMKALSYDRPENEMNLANYFLSLMRKDRNRLCEIVADDIVREGDNEEQVIRVAELAMSCLNLRGDNRPTMKEVALELEGLVRVGGKQPWVEPKGYEAESLVGDGFDSFEDYDVLAVQTL